MEFKKSSFAGEVKTTFEKLEDRATEVRKEHLGTDVAAREADLSIEERRPTRVIVQTHALLNEINEPSCAHPRLRRHRAWWSNVSQSVVEVKELDIDH